MSNLYKTLLVVLSVSFMTAACSMEGDLGRPKPRFLFGSIAETYWTSDIPPVYRHSDFSLTPDETEMRETAFRLRTLAFRPRPIGISETTETSYADYLTSQGHTFGPSRMAKIDHDLHADHQSLTLFGQAARRVLEADRERLRTVHEIRPYLSFGDKQNARNRLQENHAFIQGTFLDLDRKIAAYQYAIDRARIETPGVTPVAVGGSLNHLRDRVASLHYELAQGYELALNIHVYATGPAVPPPPENAPYSLSPPRGVKIMPDGRPYK
ncbi:MAG: hypothetical protein VX871_07725 [Pseudomonadota bacterium]|nr:hypothetical protein [Pseudomonadota bacterium]